SATQPIINLENPEQFAPSTTTRLWSSASTRSLNSSVVDRPREYFLNSVVSSNSARYCSSCSAWACVSCDSDRCSEPGPALTTITRMASLAPSSNPKSSAALAASDALYPTIMVMY